jgi:hypothetical protein
LTAVRRQERHQRYVTFRTISAQAAVDRSAAHRQERPPPVGAAHFFLDHGDPTPARDLRQLLSWYRGWKNAMSKLWQPE